MGEAQRQITAEETAQWLAERFQNCLRIGSGKTGADQAGWIEDAAYFARALEIVTRAQEEKQGMGECPKCEGLGYIVIPRCCGRPVLVWQGGSVPEPAFEECCGSPEPEPDGCPDCGGTGKRI